MASAPSWPRRLGPPAGPVRLNTAALAVRWDGPGVVVETSQGTIHADACIVHGCRPAILASGRLRFTPGLPVDTQGAIHGLPMGVLNKIALRASGADRLDLPESCGVDQFVPRDRRAGGSRISLVAWPHRQDHVICFVGGSHAAALERDGALEVFAPWAAAGVVRRTGGQRIAAGGRRHGMGAG